jgi:hypothetical protein
MTTISILKSFFYFFCYINVRKSHKKCEREQSLCAIMLLNDITGIEGERL